MATATHIPDFLHSKETEWNSTEIVEEKVTEVAGNKLEIGSQVAETVNTQLGTGTLTGESETFFQALSVPMVSVDDVTSSQDATSEDVKETTIQHATTIDPQEDQREIKAEKSVNKTAESPLEIEQEKDTEEIKSTVEIEEEKEQQGLLHVIKTDDYITAQTEPRIESAEHEVKVDDGQKEKSDNPLVKETCEETIIEKVENEEEVKDYDSSMIEINEKTTVILSKDEDQERKEEGNMLEKDQGEDAVISSQDTIFEGGLNEKNHQSEGNEPEAVETKESIGEDIEETTFQHATTVAYNATPKDIPKEEVEDKTIDPQRASKTSENGAKDEREQKQDEDSQEVKPSVETEERTEQQGLLHAATADDGGITEQTESQVESAPHEVKSVEAIQSDEGQKDISDSPLVKEVCEETGSFMVKEVSEETVLEKVESEEGLKLSEITNTALNENEIASTIEDEEKKEEVYVSGKGQGGEDDVTSSQDAICEDIKETTIDQNVNTVAYSEEGKSLNAVPKETLKEEVEEESNVAQEDKREQKPEEESVNKFVQSSSETEHVDDIKEIKPSAEVNSDEAIQNDEGQKETFDHPSVKEVCEETGSEKVKYTDEVKEARNENEIVTKVEDEEKEQEVESEEGLKLSESSNIALNENEIASKVEDEEKEQEVYVTGKSQGGGDDVTGSQDATSEDIKETTVDKPSDAQEASEPYEGEVKELEFVKTKEGIDEDTEEIKSSVETKEIEEEVIVNDDGQKNKSESPLVKELCEATGPEKDESIDAQEDIREQKTEEGVNKTLESCSEIEQEEDTKEIKHDASQTEPHVESEEPAAKSDEIIQSDEGQKENFDIPLVKEVCEETDSQNVESEEGLKLSDSSNNKLNENETESKVEDGEKEQEVDVSGKGQDGEDDVTSSQDAACEDIKETTIGEDATTTDQSEMTKEILREESKDISSDRKEASEKRDNGAEDKSEQKPEETVNEIVQSSSEIKASVETEQQGSLHVSTTDDCITTQTESEVESAEHEVKSEEAIEGDDGQKENVEIPSVKAVVYEETGSEKVEYTEEVKEATNENDIVTEYEEKEQAAYVSGNGQGSGDDVTGSKDAACHEDIKGTTIGQTKELEEKIDEEAVVSDDGQIEKSESPLVKEVCEVTSLEKAESQKEVKDFDSSSYEKEIVSKEENQEKEQAVTLSDEIQGGEEETEDKSIDAQEDKREQKPDESVNRTVETCSEIKQEEDTKEIKPSVETEEKVDCITTQRESQVEGVEDEVKSDDGKKESFDSPSVKEVCEETDSEKVEYKEEVKHSDSSYEEIKSEIPMVKETDSEKAENEEGFKLSTSSNITLNENEIMTKAEDEEKEQAAYMSGKGQGSGDDVTSLQDAACEDIKETTIGQTKELEEKIDEEAIVSDDGQTEKFESPLVKEVCEATGIEKVESEEGLKDIESFSTPLNENEIVSKEENEEKEQAVTMSDEIQGGGDNVTTVVYSEEAEDKSIDAQEDKREQKPDESVNRTVETCSEIEQEEDTKEIKPSVETEKLHAVANVDCITAQTETQVEGAEHELKSDDDGQKEGFDSPSVKEVCEETDSEKVEYKEEVKSFDSSSSVVETNVNEEKVDEDSIVNDDGQPEKSERHLDKEVCEVTSSENAESEVGLKHFESSSRALNEDEIAYKEEKQEKEQELKISEEVQGGQDDVISSQKDIKETMIGQHATTLAYFEEGLDQNEMTKEIIKEEDDKSNDAQEEKREQKPEESVNKIVESCSEIEQEKDTEESKPSVEIEEETEKQTESQVESAENEVKSDVAIQSDDVQEETFNSPPVKEVNEETGSQKNEYEEEVKHSGSSYTEMKSESPVVKEVCEETVSQKVESEEGLKLSDSSKMGLNEVEVVSKVEDQEKGEEVHVSGQSGQEDDVISSQEETCEDIKETTIGQHVTTVAYIEEGQALSSIPREILNEEVQNESSDAQEASEQYESEANDKIEQNPEESVNKVENTEEIKPSVETDENEKVMITGNEEDVSESDDGRKENSDNLSIKEVSEETHAEKVEFEGVELSNKDGDQEKEPERIISEEDQRIDDVTCSQDATSVEDLPEKKDGGEGKEPEFVKPRESIEEDTEEVKSSVETKEMEEKIDEEAIVKDYGQTEKSESPLVKELCEATVSEKPESELNENEIASKDENQEKEHELKMPEEVQGGGDDVISSSEDIKETTIGQHEEQEITEQKPVESVHRIEDTKETEQSVEKDEKKEQVKITEPEVKVIESDIKEVCEETRSERVEFEGVELFDKDEDQEKEQERIISEENQGKDDVTCSQDATFIEDLPRGSIEKDTEEVKFSVEIREIEEKNDEELKHFESSSKAFNQDEIVSKEENQEKEQVQGGGDDVISSSEDTKETLTAQHVTTVVESEEGQDQSAMTKEILREEAEEETEQKPEESVNKIVESCSEIEQEKDTEEIKPSVDVISSEDATFEDKKETTVDQHVTTVAYLEEGQALSSMPKETPKEEEEEEKSSDAQEVVCISTQMESQEETTENKEKNESEEGVKAIETFKDEDQGTEGQSKDNEEKIDQEVLVNDDGQTEKSESPLVKEVCEVIGSEKVESELNEDETVSKEEIQEKEQEVTMSEKVKGGGDDVISSQNASIEDVKETTIGQHATTVAYFEEGQDHSEMTKESLGEEAKDKSTDVQEASKQYEATKIEKEAIESDGDLKEYSDSPSIEEVCEEPDLKKNVSEEGTELSGSSDMNLNEKEIAIISKDEDQEKEQERNMPDKDHGQDAVAAYEEDLQVNEHEFVETRESIKEDNEVIRTSVETEESMEQEELPRAITEDICIPTQMESQKETMETEETNKESIENDDGKMENPFIHSVKEVCDETSLEKVEYEEGIKAIETFKDEDQETDKVDMSAEGQGEDNVTSSQVAASEEDLQKENHQEPEFVKTKETIEVDTEEIKSSVETTETEVKEETLENEEKIEEEVIVNDDSQTEKPESPLVKEVCEVTGLEKAESELNENEIVSKEEIQEKEKELKMSEEVKGGGDDVIISSLNVSSEQKTTEETPDYSEKEKAEIKILPIENLESVSQVQIPEVVPKSEDSNQKEESLTSATATCEDEDKETITKEISSDETTEIKEVEGTNDLKEQIVEEESYSTELQEKSTEDQKEIVNEISYSDSTAIKNPEVTEVRADAQIVQEDLEIAEDSSCESKVSFTTQASKTDMKEDAEKSVIISEEVKGDNEDEKSEEEEHEVRTKEISSTENLEQPGELKPTSELVIEDTKPQPVETDITSENIIKDQISESREKELVDGKGNMEEDVTLAPESQNETINNVMLTNEVAVETENEVKGQISEKDICPTELDKTISEIIEDGITKKDEKLSHDDIKDTKDDTTKGENWFLDERTRETEAVEEQSGGLDEVSEETSTDLNEKTDVEPREDVNQNLELHGEVKPITELVTEEDQVKETKPEPELQSDITSENIIKEYANQKELTDEIEYSKPIPPENTEVKAESPIELENEFEKKEKDDELISEIQNPEPTLKKEMKEEHLEATKYTCETLTDGLLSEKKFESTVPPEELTSSTPKDQTNELIPETEKTKIEHISISNKDQNLEFTKEEFTKTLVTEEKTLESINQENQIEQKKEADENIEKETQTEKELDEPVTPDTAAKEDLEISQKHVTDDLTKISQNESIEKKLSTQNKDGSYEPTAKSLIVEPEDKTSGTEPQCSNEVLKEEKKTSDEKEKTQTSEPAKISLSDMLQEQTKENSKVAETLIEEREIDLKKYEKVDKEGTGDKEAKTDEENEEEDDEDNQMTDAPVMVEASKDIEVKAHKKSHNILSGVGSKVKHSIAKVKKAITGKSSHPKPSSPKEKDQVIT
ncbi:hypothetical protein L2E82_19620 [Cichorium intybus]|uniref:Uncharacterized protein n=1 Tax=Cichorium intybus TaxID=13427 RepID=A0ACB9FCR4_CICIN|nr:hypothetical protein L2E82_19620 [Cichorium intybus]